MGRRRFSARRSATRVCNRQAGTKSGARTAREYPSPKKVALSPHRSRAPGAIASVLLPPGTFRERPSSWEGEGAASPGNDPERPPARARAANKVIMRLARRVAYPALLFRHSIPPPPPGHHFIFPFSFIRARSASFGRALLFGALALSRSAGGCCETARLDVNKLSAGVGRGIAERVVASLFIDVRFADATTRFEWRAALWAGETR